MRPINLEIIFFVGEIRHDPLEKGHRKYLIFYEFTLKHTHTQT